MFFAKLFKNSIWSLVLPAVLLSLIGLASIYSASLGKNDFLDFQKQSFFFIISFFLFLFISVFNLRFLKINSRLIFFLYILSLFLLSGVLIFGIRAHGVKGWYKIGPFSFDPIPFSALVLIIVFSKYFSSRHIETKSLRPILFSSLYLIPAVGLVLFQPDLGSALILISVWLGIIIFSGLQLRHFLILLLIFLMLFAFSWQFWLRNYQKQRIVAFFKPAMDPQGISWNINQSKIAIGSGGIFGKGIGKGSQVKYGFLPAAKTDFIFSAIAEETGLIGILFLFFIISFLLFKLIKVAVQDRDNFTRLFAAGFAFLFFSQTFINIGMSLGALPVIGVPLPFVSYGGSQMLSFYLGLGILCSLIKRS